MSFLAAIPMYLIFVVAGLFQLAGWILLGIAAYKDSLANGNKNPTMWGLLIGFLGAIPGIIYLCLRNSEKNKNIICQRCGFVHPISAPFCPHCSTQNMFSYPFNNETTAANKNAAKQLMIFGICAIGFALLLMLVGYVLTFSFIFQNVLSNIF